MYVASVGFANTILADGIKNPITFIVVVAIHVIVMQAKEIMEHIQDLSSTQFKKYCSSHNPLSFLQVIHRQACKYTYGGENMFRKIKSWLQRLFGRKHYNSCKTCKYKHSLHGTWWCMITAKQICGVPRVKTTPKHCPFRR